jgi:hypothetical protein
VRGAPKCEEKCYSKRALDKVTLLGDVVNWVHDWLNHGTVIPELAGLAVTLNPSGRSSIVLSLERMLEYCNLIDSYNSKYVRYETGAMIKSL